MNTLLFAAVAAVTNSTAVLPPVIVEASRLDKTPAEIPSSVQVIGRDEIAKSGARDVADLLQKRAHSLNVISTGAGNPSLSQIAMPGYGENGFGRVLVMVDGLRMNFADMSAPMLSQIDLGSVQKVEILHGPQSVLHGDAASAGVINIVTEPSGYETHGYVELHGGNRDTYGARAAISGGDEQEGVKYWANGGWEHSNGYRANNGWQTWTSGGGVKKEWENGSYLRLSAMYGDADYELPGWLSSSTWRSNRKRTNSPHDWYRRMTWGMNVTAEGVLNDSNRLRLDMTFSRSTMKTRSVTRGSYIDYDPGNFGAPTPVDWTDNFFQRYDLYSLEVSPQWINTSTIAGMDNELIVGSSYRYDRLHGDSCDVSVYAPDFWGSSGLTLNKFAYNRQSMGFFAQDTVYLFDGLALEGGARYQRTWDENTTLVTPRRISDTYAADASLLYTPVDDLKTYLRFGRFFRNPFLDENPFRNFVAQNVLAPETGWNVSVGADWSFLEEFSVFANMFITKTKHEILYDKFVWDNNVNAPCDIIREGFTAGASWERDKVAGARLAYTYVDAEFDGGAYDGKKVPMSAESMINASARLWIWDECFVFGGFRFLSKQHPFSDFSNESRRLPSCSLFHIGAQYAPEQAWLRGLKFSVVIDNLFNRAYADTAVRRGGSTDAVYYPAAGRSVMFTVRYEF